MGTKKWRTNGQMGAIQRGATDVLGGAVAPNFSGSATAQLC